MYCVCYLAVVVVVIMENGLVTNETGTMLCHFRVRMAYTLKAPKAAIPATPTTPPTHVGTCETWPVCAATQCELEIYYRLWVFSNA